MKKYLTPVKIVIFFLLLIIALIIFFLFIKKRSYYLKNKKLQQQKSINNMKKELCVHLNKDGQDHCLIKLVSNSQGLLLDSVIVCDVTKKLPATPIFQFEEAVDCSLSDFLFVNIDITDFNKLKSKNKPNYIMCKTKQTYNLIKDFLPTFNVVYTGFTSIDRYIPSITKDYNKFIHICGKSPFKGTINVIRTWIQNPNFPMLTVISRDNVINKIIHEINPNILNITLLTTFICEEKLNHMMNEYGVHICPSKHEGWGHYFSEAMSCKNIVLYTNKPPFSERVDNSISGVGIECKNITYSTYQGISLPVYNVSTEEISKAVEKVLAMSLEEKHQMGENARDKFLSVDRDFKEAMHNVIKGDVTIPHIIHTMWIDKNNQYVNVSIPDDKDKYIKTWKKYNKNFIFMQWSGKDIIELIETNFPEYLSMYKKLQPTIRKCDFARFVVIAVYGGVYTDIDFFCKKNITPLLFGENYFVFEPDEHVKRAGNKLLCNGFFAARKKDPFVLGWLEKMNENVVDDDDVLRTTGPVGLYNYYRSTPNKVLLGNKCNILSINNFDFTTAEECKGDYNTFIGTIWNDGSDWAGLNKQEFESRIIQEKNPIDGSDMLWEKSKFLDDNWPGLSYDVEEKKMIFELAKNNKRNFGVIDVGAHIGDLAISLALALQNCGREDVMVYAIDPTREKCDFIEKMSIVNAINNIKVLNFGLSDTYTHKDPIYDIIPHKGNNTGGTQWENKNNTKGTLFVTLDSLVENGKIGPIGLYHIDVEGHEIECLNGSKNLILRDKPILCVESFLPNTEEKCTQDNILEKCSEFYNTIKNLNYSVSGQLPNGDLIFYSI